MHGNSNTEPRSPIRLACIGGSLRSAVGRAHLNALGMDRKFKVVTGCFSRDSEINKKSADAFGVDRSRVHADIDSLLEAERGEIDAALIITPTDQHAEQVEKFLRKGIFVICEKALATSSRAVSRLKDCQPTGGFDIAVVYNYLGYPMLRELKVMIGAGRLGKIQQIHIEMPQEGFAKLNRDHSPMIPQSWRLRDFETVSAVSLDLGVHVHSIVRFLTGAAPTKVVARAESLGNFSDIVDNVNCLALYDNELSCNIWFGKVALGERNGLRVRVFGEIGSAEWRQEYPEELKLADVYGNRTVIDRGNNNVEIASQARYTRFKVGHPAGFIEALANFYWDVGDLLDRRAGGLPLDDFKIYSVDAALEGLKMMEAITLSSQSSKWENI